MPLKRLILIKTLKVLNFNFFNILLFIINILTTFDFSYTYSILERFVLKSEVIQMISRQLVSVLAHDNFISDKLKDTISSMQRHYPFFNV